MWTTSEENKRAIHPSGAILQLEKWGGRAYYSFGDQQVQFEYHRTSPEIDRVPRGVAIETPLKQLQWKSGCKLTDLEIDMFREHVTEAFLSLGMEWVCFERIEDLVF